MATYRVLVSDPISEKGVDALRAAPEIQVDVNTGLKPEELLAIIGDYHGLVVRSQTKVTPEVFAAAKNLKAIGRAGVGVDNIDRSAATDHGVVVMNTPSGNTISTAEHAFSLMLSLARNIPQAHASVIAGKWDRKAFEGRGNEWQDGWPSSAWAASAPNSPSARQAFGMTRRRLRSVSLPAPVRRA